MRCGIYGLNLGELCIYLALICAVHRLAVHEDDRLENVFGWEEL